MPSKSVCLLVGNEEFLKEEWIKAARQKVFKDSPPAAESTDFLQLGPTDLDSPASLFDTAKTSPFLSKKRLLVLRDIEKIFSNAQTQRQLLDYARSPAAHTILVLDAGIKEKDFPPNKFFEQLSGLAYVKTFKKIYDRDLSAWILERFAKRHKKSQPPAAELLKQLKGNDLRLLDAEIEKLCVYAGSRPSITTQDVRQLVGRDILSQVDDVIYAISRQDKKGMIEASFDFQNLDRRDFGGAIGLFCWQLRRILRGKIMIKENRSAKKIASELKLWSRDIEKFMFQCKNLKSSWIRNAIGEIVRFDLGIKTGAQPDTFLDWQMLLLRLFALAFS